MTQARPCPACGTRRDVVAEGETLCAACLLGAALDGSVEEADAVDLAAAEALLGDAGWPASACRVIAVLAGDDRHTSYLAQREIGAGLVVLDVWKAAGGATAPGLFEARLRELARINHPAVAAVLEGRQGAGGECCLVSCFTGGRAIHRYAEARGLADVERRALVDEARQALRALHESGVVHGNLSEETLLVVEEAGARRVVLAGFVPVLPRDASRAADEQAIDAVAARLAPASRHR